MKKITLFVVVLLALALVMPVHADREAPTVGEKISIYDDGEPEFPAGRAFYISHGWLAGPSEAQALGVFDFTLEIDCKLVKGGLRYTLPDLSEEPGRVVRIYNFPDGMPAGTYTFVGRWYQPCQYVDPPLSCPDPNKPVLNRTSTVEITFKP